MEASHASEQSGRNFMSTSHGMLSGKFIFVPENVTLHTYARFGDSIPQTPEDIHIKNMLNKEPFNYPGPGMSRVVFSDRKDGSNQFKDAGYRDEKEWMDIDGTRERIKTSQEIIQSKKISINTETTKPLSQYYEWVEEEMRTYESGQIVPEHLLSYNNLIGDQLRNGLIDIDKLKDILEVENQREIIFREAGINFKDYFDNYNKEPKNISGYPEIVQKSFNDVFLKIQEYLINYYGALFKRAESRQIITDRDRMIQGLLIGHEYYVSLILEKLAGEGAEIATKETKDAWKSDEDEIARRGCGGMIFPNLPKRVYIEGILGGTFPTQDTRPGFEPVFINNETSLSELFEKAKELASNTPGLNINIYLFCCRSVDGMDESMLRNYNSFFSKLRECKTLDEDIFKGTFLEDIDDEEKYVSLTRDGSFSGLEIKKNEIIDKLKEYERDVLTPLGVPIELIKLRVLPISPVGSLVYIHILNYFMKTPDEFISSLSDEKVFENITKYLKNLGVMKTDGIFRFLDVESDHIINKLLNSRSEENIISALDLIRMYYIFEYNLNEIGFKTYYTTYYITLLRGQAHQYKKDIREIDPYRSNINGIHSDIVLTEYGYDSYFNVPVLCSLLYFLKNIDDLKNSDNNGLYERKCFEENEKYETAGAGAALAPTTIPPDPEVGTAGDREDAADAADAAADEGGLGDVTTGDLSPPNMSAGGRRRKKKRKTKRKKSKKNPKRKSKRKSKKKRR